MLRSPIFALVAAIATLALPATTFAQSAGNDQYQDPLGGSGGGGTPGHITNTPGGGGSGSSGAPSSGSNVPTAGSAGTSSGTPTPTSGEGASGTPRGQLPRTGFDVIVSFELGLAMLLAGLVARRMIALRERREN